jgi:hypothetical protein
VLWATDRPRAAPAGAPTPRRPPPRTSGDRQVREALRRVFGDAVAIEAGRAMAGDFNQDGSEDLAAVARAAPGGLAQINDEFANWIVQDAAAPGRASTGVTVAASDPLLAVLHGHGSAGWRNPEARQAYLVRVSLARPRVVKHALVDDAPGHPGFLCWSGSRYVWSSTPLPPGGR